ncbi:MAG: multiheme c-type cytochrome, partial [Rhizobacter sp.]
MTSTGRLRWIAAASLALSLVACGGGSGNSGDTAPATLPPNIDTGPTALAAAGALSIRVDSASIDHRPVVEFTVTNAAGAGMTGLVAADLRFNVAKLAPGSNGEPSGWQNYINQAQGGVVQGSQERAASGYAFGTLTGLGSGRYRYAFATDITDPAANPCPAACSDAAGKPLDIRYDAGLTHRVTIEQANPAYPRAAGTLDFVPAGGPPATQREIVATATCNGCHAELTAHATRVDTRLCVSCHNAGSSVAGAPNTPLDFK